MVRFINVYSHHKTTNKRLEIQSISDDRNVYIDIHDNGLKHRSILMVLGHDRTVKYIHKMQLLFHSCSSSSLVEGSLLLSGSGPLLDYTRQVFWVTWQSNRLSVTSMNHTELVSRL